MRRNNQGCHYDVINNHKTGVAMLLQGIYTNYHVLPMRRPAGRLHNKSLSVTYKIKKSDVTMTRNITDRKSVV